MAITHNQSASKSPEYLFIKFARKILALMKPWASAEGISRLIRPYVDFAEDGYTPMVEIKNDYWRLLIRHYKDILKMKEFELCARRLLEEGLLKPPKMTDNEGKPILNPPFEDISNFVIQDLLKPVIDILERHNTFNPSHEQILESYQHFKNLWTAPVRWNITIPLLNFEGDIPRTSISSMFDLAPFTPEDKTSLWDTNSFLDEIISFREFREAKFKLAGSYTEDKPYANQDVSIQLGCLITALRLFKAGGVGISAKFRKSNSVYSWRSGYSIESASSDYQIRRVSTPYTLDKSELLTVLTLFNELLKGTQQNQLGDLTVALRRFNQSYSRDIAEDRIIDLTIALESGLLSNIEDELRYRLSIRGAALLSDKRNPMETQSLLTAIYDARSAIVHDGKNLSELNKILRKVAPPLQPHELPQRCEDITRHILKTYIARLTKGKRLEEINNELDRRVVENLTLNSSTSP